ncbi:MAG TPA: hypothetical protein VEB59_05235, partial [Gemmatimonadales bacterium]|nr:hypothetical protein [Gemmatimonadales bacterium]
DGRSQPPGDARCTAFEEAGGWAWIQGEFGRLDRTLVAGPDYLLDLVGFNGAEERVVELSWHPAGRLEAASRGRWAPGELADEFVRDVERFEPGSDGGVTLVSETDGRRLHLHLRFEGELLRATAPGVPGAGSAPVVVASARGRAVRFVSVLETGDSPRVRAVRMDGEVVEVECTDRTDRHARTEEGWEVTAPGTKVVLRGRRKAAEAVLRPLIDVQRRIPPRTVAPHLPVPAALEAAEPLLLDHEDQYRRSEEPYPGAEEFSARALVGWVDQSLHLDIAVAVPEPVFRATDAAPLLLDNDPDDVHSDGLQLYLRPDPAGPVHGFLVVPDPDAGTVRVQGASGTAGRAEMVTGESSRTDEGYRITLVVTLPDWDPRTGDELGFDLLVNRMEPGRERRAGQLAWSGGGGWVYLRGDRADPAGFGVLELG